MDPPGADAEENQTYADSEYKGLIHRDRVAILGFHGKPPTSEENGTLVFNRKKIPLGKHLMSKLLAIKSR